MINSTGDLTKRTRDALAPKADEIAKRMRSTGDDIPNWHDIRDACDLATYSDLNPFALDMLADMVENRLNNMAK